MKKTGGIRWRVWLTLALLVVLCGSAALGALKVRRYVITDPKFTLSRERNDAFSISGQRNASRSKVLRVFAEDFDHSVFTVPLEERRRRLLAIDWVEDASVSRIWPDRLAIRIRERTPVAFVLSGSEVLLIDANGVLLEPPPRTQFMFPVLSGLREGESESQRRARVRAMLAVQRDMGYLAKDISEIDVSDPDDTRIVAQVNSTAVELMMGDSNYALRYQNFLNHYAEIARRSPKAKVYDLRLDDRIIVKE